MYILHHADAGSLDIWRGKYEPIEPVCIFRAFYLQIVHRDVKEGNRNMKIKVRYCGYGYVEQTAGDLLETLTAGREYVDLKVVGISDIMAAVVLIYKE